MEWRHTRWDEAQLVYTAIAKVANTSIKSALLESFAPDVSRQNPHDAEVPYKTLRADRIHAEAPDYLHVAVVRNPFDRFVSFWADKIDGEGMNHGLRERGFEKGMPFNEAARLAAELSDEETDPHIRSQAFLIADANGGLRPDLILRFERLAHDWDLVRHLVRQRAGVEIVSLPRRRVSEHGTYWSYYDDETTELIRGRFAADFDLLNYEAPKARLRRLPIDDELERLLPTLPAGAAVLDLTPATIDRARLLSRIESPYLAPARHNRLGQLARFTALERGRVPENAFDVLLVDETASASREPHRTLTRRFEESGRPVLYTRRGT